MDTPEYTEFLDAVILHSIPTSLVICAISSPYYQTELVLLLQEDTFIEWLWFYAGHTV